MHLKDYYHLLELEPSATLPEIKKAYRKLALRYHPDKNQNDPYASAQFTEIKEAYEVLTNPSKKEVYLQRRWYQQSTGSKRTSVVLTPASFLKQVLELEKYISKLDVFRMDKQGLHDYMAGMLSNGNIEKLNTYRDTSANDGIVNLLLVCLQPLPLPLLLPLYAQLCRIEMSAVTRAKLDVYIKSRQKYHQRDAYRIWLIVLIVIITCLLIFFLGR